MQDGPRRLAAGRTSVTWSASGILADVKPRKVVVIGQGYVGLPVAKEAVAAGHDVVGQSG